MGSRHVDTFDGEAGSVLGFDALHQSLDLEPQRPALGSTILV
jgi:hypothetical protein